MRYHKLILSILTILLTFLLTTTQMFAAGVPQMIPYSGTIAVNGAPFNGNGQFKFAIVSQGCEDTNEATPCTSLWSNDGSKTDGSEPTDYVTITVNNGGLGVKLGDTSLKNKPSDTGMLAIPDTVFANDVTYLRIWFNDGVIGPQQLSPDRQLVSVPYAYRASTADNVGTGQIADGSITTVKIVNGAVGSAQIADGTVTITDLAFDPATQAELDAHKGGGDHDSRYPAKTDLSATGTINTATNPMDWTKLKSVPAGFADGVDDTGQIADGSITTAKIADGAVTSAKIASGAVGTAQIVDGAVTTADLAFDPATQAELDATKTDLNTTGTINTAANPVDWTKLKSVPFGFADGSDDTSGTASDVVCAGCVGSTDIANNAVGSAQINDLTIANADISATAAIADTKLAQISTAGKIAAAALPSDGYATTYVNVTGDTMTGGLIVPSLTYSIAKTEYFNIPAAAFTPTDNAYDYDTEGGWGGSRITMNTGAGNFVAPVYLPNGSTITSMRYYYFDASASDTTAFLRRVENMDNATSTAWTTMTTAASSGTPGFSNALTTSITYPTINNNLYSYFVYVSLPATSLFLYGVKIEYTYTSP